MAFNAGREFNKFASTQGAGFSAPFLASKARVAFCGNALQHH